MYKFIAILRGINVSGQKIMKMTELRSLFEELAFKDVRTYIQSGNIVFCSSISSERTVKLMIQKKIREIYKFDVSVIILTKNKLNKIISQNPFDIKKIEISKLYFCFMDQEPPPELIGNLSKIDLKEEQFEVIKDTIYLYYPRGAGRAKLSNNFIENKLKVTATSRNWNTTNKLKSMIKELKC